MGKLTKRQQKQLKYFLKDKADRAKKSAMLHEDQVPKYIEKHIPVIRRLARNLDQILIVSSFVSPPLKTGLIDRFLVMSEIEQLRVLICFNKTDLLENQSDAEKFLDMYRSIGYQAVSSSVKTGSGLEAISCFLQGNRTALAGHSGVGKSSILNAIKPDLELEVNEVSGHTNKGRHTTTRVRIFHLDEKTEIIDLPGIKMVDFVDIHRDEARFYFKEFLPFAETCKFRDCLHLTEHDCAVKNAVDDGSIHKKRYKSYKLFVDSLE